MADKEKFSKWTKVRKVTFARDYFAGGRLLYRKGTTAFMHEDVANGIKARGGSVEIEKYNRSGEEEKATAKKKAAKK